MSNFLSFELTKKAEWRAKKADRHPEDSRNSAAVHLLRGLSEQPATSADADFLSSLEGDVDHSGTTKLTPHVTMC